MSLEAITKIRAVEDQMEQAKAAGFAECFCRHFHRHLHRGCRRYLRLGVPH